MMKWQKRGRREKAVETDRREICEKTLKNRHFRKKKRRKKQVLGVVFSLRLYYNVVSSGEKWLKRELFLRIDRNDGERW